MWSAELISVEKKNGMAHAKVRFVSDAGDVPIEMVPFGDNFDAAALKNWVYMKLQSLNAADAAFASLDAEAKGPIVAVKPADKTT